MIKNFSIPIILFLIGLAFGILGVLFKILHWGWGNFHGGTFLIIASVIQLIAIFIAISKLFHIYRN